MTWFRVDDNLAYHPKAVAAGNTALGLWVRAGSWSMQQLTDGFVPEEIVRTLGGGKNWKRSADRLVSTGLWTAVEGGYVFHQFNAPGRQPTREDVQRDRASARERMAKRRRSSGEVQGEVRPNLARSNAVSSASPSRPVLIGTGSQSSTGGSARGTDDDLDKIVRAIGGRCDRDHARRVWFEILGRASGDVKDPLAYVLRAIGKEPGRYMPAPRTPAKSEQCPDHPGEWADGCRACAADAKAAEADYDPWAATP